MDLFVNELSLQGQFTSLGSFVAALKEVLGCRSVAEQYQQPFFCLRTITTHNVMPGVSFRDAVQQTRNMSLIRVVMGWIDKHGPFWEDKRSHGPDDYFEHAGEVVTDCGIAEAAFRMAREQASATISFGGSAFCITPLRVLWRRSDSESDDLELPNFWDKARLEVHLRDHETAPQSWVELIERAQMRYQNLIFVDSILDVLAGEPFSSTIAERVMVLLGVLDKLKDCYDAQASLTVEGHQLLQAYFHGDRALFSDESDTNKRTFARQLTFRTSSGEEIFCPYHGKISFRYYRIHHSWPILPDQPLYIAYIGPKITKS